MAVLRQAEAQRIAQDAIVLDLGDLRRQAEHIKNKAGFDASTIVEQARAERERLLTGAAEEGRAVGFAQGLKEGREAGRAEGAAAALAERRAELQKVEQAWIAALAEFESQRERMLREARQDVLRMAVSLAERITHRRVATDPSVVAGQLEAVLSLLSRPTQLTVTIHPDDLQVATDALPGLLARLPAATHAELRTDATLSRGSCIARTASGGVIDASIATQLERMADALLPAPTPEAGE
jgi:flagellar assembly protein FliH